MLPRAPRTVLRAAKDDMPPYDGYEVEVAKRRISRDNVGVSFAKPTDDRAARLKQLIPVSYTHLTLPTILLV